MVRKATKAIRHTRKRRFVITTVYFIRHAESDSSIRNAMTRPLTPKGLQDRKKIIDFLEGQHIDAVLYCPVHTSAQWIL